MFLLIFILIKQIVHLSHKLAASLAALGTATVGPSLAQADEPEGPVAHGAWQYSALLGRWE